MSKITIIIFILGLYSCLLTKKQSNPNTTNILHCDFKRHAYSIPQICEKMGISDSTEYLYQTDGTGSKLIFCVDNHKLYWFDLEKWEKIDSMIFPYKKYTRYNILTNPNYTAIFSYDMEYNLSVDTIPYKLILLDKNQDSSETFIFYDYNTSFSHDCSSYLMFITKTDRYIYLTSELGVTYKVDISQKRLIYKPYETIDIQNGKVYGCYYYKKLQDSIIYQNKKYVDYNALSKDNFGKLPDHLLDARDTIKVFQRDNIIMKIPIYERSGNQTLISGGFFYRENHAWISKNNQVEQVDFDKLLDIKYVIPSTYGFEAVTKDSLYIFRKISCED